MVAPCVQFRAGFDCPRRLRPATICRPPSLFRTSPPGLTKTLSLSCRVLATRAIQASHLREVKGFAETIRVRRGLDPERVASATDSGARRQREQCRGRQSDICRWWRRDKSLRLPVRATRRQNRRLAEYDPAHPAPTSGRRRPRLQCRNRRRRGRSYRLTRPIASSAHTLRQLPSTNTHRHPPRANSAPIRSDNMERIDEVAAAGQPVDEVRSRHPSEQFGCC